MLVLRLLVMVLTIICLMDGHAEVSSSTTAMRNGGESPAVKQNEMEVQILDRKKKKKPKPGKKKKPKPNKKKKPKPNKAKPTPTKPVTTTPTISTSKLKTTTITTTARTTTTTVSPITTATTAKTTTSTASATTTLSTTTSATTTAKTTSTATTTTTISITATTSSPATTTATTADSGAGGECKATNGKLCIFPFKDGNEEYNECKNEGGKYFWCATSVYDSGKYKHWSYCPNDGSCPIPGDEECRATNNKPCVFPFKDGNKEYNECADHGGKYFWCATGTNSAGKYTAWSECPKDGSCPLPPKSTPPGATSTLTIATTTLPNTASSMPVTTVSPQESASTTVLVKDGEKIFSCRMDFTFESTSGFKMNSNFSSSCSPTSSATKHYKNFDEYTFDITTSSGAEINCKINIAIQDETSGISMATKPMEKSLECSVDESNCVTISGEHFPTTCVVPFIHEGRKYQACTDKGGKDAGKFWCATAVDENEEMTKWGYCSTACGYCGGKDVTDQDTRSVAECGYDCFINPYKPMEPKTQGIDPKLLSAPKVSYFEDEMTNWNKLPNIQFQFLQGQPGVFLTCIDGFNHFPCHQSIYIKCTGNYRFTIHAAELKDNTATIGEFIQNDVKNVQIGCGPCPMGFIYKVGDEVSTYSTSWGKYYGVPDIGACRNLCNTRDCPTFVYSSEDKYCELHSERIENPSNPVFKDYRLCSRQEEDSCESTCSSSRVFGLTWSLNCPAGYQPVLNGPALYKMWHFWSKETSPNCITQCQNSPICKTFMYSTCNKCQLLTTYANTGILGYVSQQQTRYCVPDCVSNWDTNCMCGTEHCDNNNKGCNMALNECVDICLHSANFYVANERGCLCGGVLCPMYHTCSTDAAGNDVCKCDITNGASNICDFNNLEFCIYHHLAPHASRTAPCIAGLVQTCLCTAPQACPHARYLEKHVCDDTVSLLPSPNHGGGYTNVNCINQCETTSAGGTLQQKIENAWYFSLRRNAMTYFPAFITHNTVKSDQNTVIMQSRNAAGYTPRRDGTCTMNNPARIYKCNMVPSTKPLIRAEAPIIFPYAPVLQSVPGANDGATSKGCFERPILRACTHSLTANGHLDVGNC